MTILISDGKSTDQTSSQENEMGNQSVIVDGLANLPEAFVWVFIGKPTHVITPKAQIYKMHFLWVKNTL